MATKNKPGSLESLRGGIAKTFGTPQIRLQSGGPIRNEVLDKNTNKDMSNEDGYWDDVYPGVGGVDAANAARAAAAGAAKLPPKDVNAAFGGKVSLTRPSYRYDSNKDGKIDDTDDIDPKYKSGRGKSMLAGAALGAMMGQKYQNPWSQLGFMLGGLIGGAINPQLAGEKEFEYDLERYNIQTDTEIKQATALANVQYKAARTEYTDAQTRYRTMQVGNLQNDQDKENLYNRMGFDIKTLTDQAPYLTEQDRVASENGLRNDLDKFFKSIGSPMDVRSMTRAELVDYANQVLVDPKASVETMGFYYYKRNRLGQQVLVTDKGVPLTTSNYATFLQTQVREKANEKLKGADKSELTQPEIADLWARAEKAVKDRGDWVTEKSGNQPNSYTRKLIATYFDAFVNQTLRERGAKDVDEYINVPRPDGSFQKAPLSELFRTTAAAPGGAATTTGPASATNLPANEENKVVGVSATVAPPVIRFSQEGFTPQNTATIMTQISSMPESIAQSMMRTRPASRDRSGRTVPASQNLTDLGKLFSAAVYGDNFMETVSSQLLPFRQPTNASQRSANALQMASMLGGLESQVVAARTSSVETGNSRPMFMLNSAYNTARPALIKSIVDMSDMELPPGVTINDVSVNRSNNYVILNFDTVSMSRTDDGNYRTTLKNTEGQDFVLNKNSFSNFADLDKLENGKSIALKNNSGVVSFVVSKDNNGKLYFGRILTFGNN